MPVRVRVSPSAPILVAIRLRGNLKPVSEKRPKGFCWPVLHLAAHLPILRTLVAAGWSSLVARRAHNPKVVGSNPTPATTTGTAHNTNVLVE